MASITANTASLREISAFGLRIALGILAVAVLVSSVLVFGGTEPVVIFANHLLVALGIPLVFILYSVDVKALGATAAYLKKIFIFWAAFLAYVLVQFWSVNRFATLDGFIDLTGYMLFFIVCLAAFQERIILEKTLSFLSLFVFAVTLFGVAQKTSGSKKIYWNFDVGSTSFFGPFIYENTFGAFIALAFPLLLALVGYRILKTHSDWLKDQSRTMIGLGAGLLNSGVVFFALLLIFAIVAVFFAQARASFFVMIFMSFGALLLWAFRRKKPLYIVAVLLGACVLAVFLLNAGTVFKTYDLESLVQNDLSYRLAIYRDALTILSDYGLLGTGVGTFFFVAPRYLTLPAELNSFMHPNSDYVELLTDTGIAGTILVSLAFLSLVLPVLKRLGRMRSRWFKLMALQGFLAVFSLGFMSFFDPHLKVPSIAYFFAFQWSVLSAAGLHALLKERPERAANPSRRGVFITAFSIALLSLALACHATSRYYAGVSSGIEAELLSKPPVFARYGFESQNPVLWQKKGKAHIERGEIDEGLRAFEKAMMLAPTYAHYVFAYGQAQYLHGNKAKGIEALEKSVELAPVNRLNALFLLSAYLRDRDLVLSSVKKEELTKKASELLARLERLPIPPGPNEFQTWMFNYNTETLNALRRPHEPS